MESVSFGSLSTSTGSPRLGGTASKLDTESIVEATYEAKRLPAVRLENRTTQNEEKIAAFEDMRSLLTNLQSAADGLRNPPGFFGVDSNVFETKQAFFSSDSATPPSDLVGVAVANSAAPGNFDLTVKQLATAAKQSTASVTAADATLGDDWNGGVAFSGTLEVGLDGGTSAAINVDSTMSIYDLRDAINGERGTTGVRATVLKVSDSDFRLVMTAEETGKAMTLTDSTGIAGGFVTHELQAAQPAIVELDGVEITRLTNEADDILPGVTISLFKADPGTKVNVSIDPSLGDVKEQISEFVGAYNAFRDFVTEQSAVDSSGKPADDAFLFGDRTMRSAMSRLGTIVGGGVAGLDGASLSSFRAIGIELDADNRLKVDDSKLDNALVTKLEDVRNIFEFRYTSSSPDLAVFARPAALSTSAMTVEITDSDADGVPESATINGVAAEVDGSTIKGAAGSEFAGLELLWNGNGDAIVDIEATQGLADQVFSMAKPATDTLNGSIKQAIDDLKDRNSSYSKQIDRIEDRAVRARDMLIERFSAMEAALTMANTMLEQIRAQVGAMNGDN